MPARFAAKESVGYYGTWTLGRQLGGIDIAGWTFKATFERYASDPSSFTLNMAANAEAQGFQVFDGPARRITCRILPATLIALPDTTGDFKLYADLLATPSGGDRFFVNDLELTVKRGPTA